MNEYYVMKQFKKGHMNTTNDVMKDVTGKKLILLQCICKERFYTRSDLNWHMVTQCPTFRQYLL